MLLKGRSFYFPIFSIVREEMQKETARSFVFITAEYDIKRKFHHIILTQHSQLTFQRSHSRLRFGVRITIV